jgi:hypothetical protein
MYKIKSKEGLLTCQDRVVAQMIGIILNEVSSWALPSEEKIMLEETISEFTQFQDGQYEVDRSDLILFYNRLVDLYAYEIGL